MLFSWSLFLDSPPNTPQLPVIDTQILFLNTWFQPVSSPKSQRSHVSCAVLSNGLRDCGAESWQLGCVSLVWGGLCFCAFSNSGPMKHLYWSLWAQFASSPLELCDVLRLLAHRIEKNSQRDRILTVATVYSIKWECIYRFKLSYWINCIV